MAQAAAAGLDRRENLAVLTSASVLFLRSISSILSFWNREEESKFLRVAHELVLVEILVPFSALIDDIDRLRTLASLPLGVILIGAIAGVASEH